jgi:hypothetical protein
MEEKKKKKSGNEYLKEKIAQLEKEYAILLDTHKEEMETGRMKVRQLQETVDAQSKEISELTAKLHNEQSEHESDVKRIAAMADDLMHYMGWLRRWIWVTLRAEKFVG